MGSIRASRSLKSLQVDLKQHGVRAPELFEELLAQGSITKATFLSFETEALATRLGNLLCRSRTLTSMGLEFCRVGEEGFWPKLLDLLGGRECRGLLVGVFGPSLFPFGPPLFFSRSWSRVGC